MFNHKILSRNNNINDTKLIGIRSVYKLLIISLIVLLMFASAQLIGQTAFGLDNKNNVDKTTKNESKSIYDITVGQTIIGEDPTKWSGEGQDEHYTITDPISASFYPASNTLKLYGGTISQYFQFTKTVNGKKHTFETSGVISVNNIDPASDYAVAKNPQQINSINIEVAADTNLVMNQHTYCSDTSNPEVLLFHHSGISTCFDNNGNNPCDLFLYGSGKLIISCNNHYQSDYLNGVIARDLIIGQNSLGDVLGATINFPLINAVCDKGTAGADVYCYYGRKINFVSANTALNKCSVMSYSVSRFIFIETYYQLEIDKDSIIDVQNVFVSGGLVVQSDDDVQINCIYCIGDIGIINHGKVLMASREGESFKAVYQGEKVEEEDLGYIDINGILINNISEGKLESDGDIEIGTFCIDCSSKAQLESRAWMSGITCEGQNEGEGILLNNCKYSFNKHNKSYINYSCSTAGQREVVFRHLSALKPGNIYLDNVEINALDPIIDAGESSWAISILDICPYTYTKVNNSVINLNKNIIKNIGEHKITNNAFFATIDSCKITNSNITLTDTNGSQQVCAFECGQEVIIGAKSILDISLLPGSKMIQSPVTEQSNDEEPEFVMETGISPYVYYSSDYKNIECSTILDKKCYDKGVCFFRVFDNDNAYNLSFETNGGSSIASQRVFAGYTGIRPEDPIKENVTFNNWYKEETFENTWDFPKDTVDKDTTVYAKWDSSFSPIDNPDANSVSDSPENSLAQTSDDMFPLIGLFLLITFCSATIAARTLCKN